MGVRLVAKHRESAMSRSVEELVAEEIRRNSEPKPLRALVDAVRGVAPESDSTDVKFAVFSLVRQGKAQFDTNWKVRLAAG